MSSNSQAPLPAPHLILSELQEHSSDGRESQVCDVCGEPYFDAETTQRLLDIAWEASQSGILVDVRRYLAA